MTLAFRSAETSPYVRALLADQGIADGSIDLAIDARDEMLSFLVQSADGDRERALFAYFRSGLSIADSMAQILRWRFGDRLDNLLDFASGYGRVTRFLLRTLPAERIWVSDVYADGVRFQEERFGVHGIVSTVRPEDFTCADAGADAGVETFDAITVTSLFTHLPDGRFVAWLRVLLGLLRPGGALVFSAHGPEVLGPGCVISEQGILFQELSESGSLDTSDYGSTWVTEDYVRSAVARAAGADLGPVSVCRLTRGLCNFQDLYVAVRAGGVDFSSFTYHGEPQLQIDDCSLSGPDTLALRGWALVRSGGVRAVEVLVDGEVRATAAVEGPRPDVAAAYGDPRFAQAGWSCTCPLPPGASRTAAVLLVRVVDARGVSWPLWASSIEALLLASARQEGLHLRSVVNDLQARLAVLEARAEAERAALEARIAAMEASRFWKMRNAWFRLKGIARR
jgi:SAM-dependent methyltransferase